MWRRKRSHNPCPPAMLFIKKGFDRMRLDKYLKVSRLIKRRTVANEACDAGRVVVNGKIARASYDVKVNDVIELTLGARTVKARVVSVNEYAKKDEAAMMYEIIEEK